METDPSTVLLPASTANTDNLERNATTNATFFSCDQLKSNKRKAPPEPSMPRRQFRPAVETKKLLAKKAKTNEEDQEQAGRSRNQKWHLLCLLS